MVGAMPFRPFLLLLGAGSLIVLPSCKLFTVPVRVVGAVAEGTAKVGKKAAVATADAFSESEEEKKEEAKEKAAKKKAEEESAPATESADPAGAPAQDTLPDDYLPPLQETEPSLSEDEPFPYQEP